MAAAPTDKLVGIMVGFQGEVTELAEIYGDCQICNLVYPQLLSIGYNLVVKGIIRSASFFIVEPTWVLGQPIDIYRCTDRDPRFKQP